MTTLLILFAFLFIELCLIIYADKKMLTLDSSGKVTQLQAGDSGFTIPTYGIEANRPTAASTNNGLIYCATDTKRIWRSTGSTWELFNVALADATGATQDCVAYGASNGSLQFSTNLKFTGTAFEVIGDAKVSSTTATLFLDRTAAATPSRVLFRDTTNTKLNWLVGAQQNNDNSLEITRSTAAGGSTYSTPSVVFKSDGSTVFGPADPGGSELLRVGGLIRATSSVIVTGIGPTAVLSSSASTDATTLAYISLQRNGAEKGWVGYGDGVSGVFKIYNSIGRLAFSATEYLFGSDPGGAEILRGTGDVNFTGLLRSGGINVNPWRWSNTASQSVVNTVTKTTLLGTGVGSKTIPANSLRQGSVIRFTAAGTATTTGTPNLILEFSLGTFSDEFFNDVMPTDTDTRWRVELLFVVNTIGAAGKISGMVTFLTGDSGFGFGSNGSVSVNQEADFENLDTTIANVFNFTAQWGTANALNEIKLFSSTLEILNANS